MASSLIQTAAHEDANIIFGAVLDEKMGDEVKITVIATGFRHDHFGRRQRANDALVAHVSVNDRFNDRVSDKPRLPRFASEEAEEFSPLFEPRQVPEHQPTLARRSVPSWKRRPRRSCCNRNRSQSWWKRLRSPREPLPQPESR